MTDILKVIKPFYMLKEGDTFKINEDGDKYSSVYSESYDDESGSGTQAVSYTRDYTISTDYAEELIKEGYLEAVEPRKNSSFINVFDEIDNLLETYSEDLKNTNEDFEDMPQCMKVERETVLSNLIKVLNHLKNLKK